MKVYDGDGGYHCFGCGQHGSVIDFVMNYFKLDFAEAQKKLNDDFFLRLPIGEQMSLKEYRKAQKAIRERKAKQEAEQAERERLERDYWEAFSRYAQFDRQLMENRPTSPSDTPNPLFLEAVSEIGYAEYLLDLAQMRLYDANKSK